MYKYKKYRYLVDVYEEQVIDAGLYDTINDVLLGQAFAHIETKTASRVLEDGRQVTVDGTVFYIRADLDYTITNNCYFIFDGKRYNFVSHVDENEMRREYKITTTIQIT